MKGNFQIIIIAVFIALAIFGILVFSGTIKIGQNNQPGALGTVVLWGTTGQNTISPLLEEFNSLNQSFIVKYEQKDAETFDRDLLEALATGTGPDIIILPETLAFKYSNKISPIPYTSYPVANFKTAFAGAGEVFLTSRGILAFPLSVDPLVMYYDRSVFDANGIVYPPVYWDDLLALVPKLTKKDESNKILKSAVALGHYTNVAHAKDILSALFLQAGSKIVTEKEGFFSSNLSSSLSSILQFYTSFADPVKENYSWNRSFPNSADAFSSGDLALYFGFSSELSSLINKNPNQNFFVAPLPQIKGASTKATASHVTGISVLSSSKNPVAAFTAASLLSSGNFASEFAASTGGIPARRDLLALRPSDAYSPIFYASALFSKSWLDPSPADTENIFRAMVEGVLANSISPGDAVSDADTKINFLLSR